MTEVQKFYTGVGKRATPYNILVIMKDIAELLEQRGYILRSGAAAGADKAFESGVTKPQNKCIYTANQATPEAMAIAARYHPVWDRLPTFAKKLHGRNSFQVLGDDLKTPSEFLICWTVDGCTQHIGRSAATGGTGTAISIADATGVRVCNLKRPDHYTKTINWIKQMKGNIS